MRKFKILIKAKSDSARTYVEIEAKNIKEAESEVIKMYKSTRLNMYFKHNGIDGIPRKDIEGSSYKILHGNLKTVFYDRKKAIRFYKRIKVNKSLWVDNKLLDSMSWSPM